MSFVKESLNFYEYFSRKNFFKDIFVLTKKQNVFESPSAQMPVYLNILTVEWLT